MLVGKNIEKHLVVQHLMYWAAVQLFLALFFGQSWNSFSLGFFFSAFLLPIVAGTTYFFNYFLVPRYLFPGYYGSFTLYFFYTLVVSLYLEMLVILFSFAVIANYQLNVMSITSTSIYMLGITLYLIVFVTSFIRLIIQYKEKVKQVELIENKQAADRQRFITIRADRKNHPVPYHELLYLESLSDYVKVITASGTLITREKITRLASLLPDGFVRIHRSFVVNIEQVQTYSSHELTINNATLPIGRTYKKQALTELQKRVIERS